MGRYTKPLATDKQIKAYKLVSPDFEGLSEQQAAEKMGISQQALSGLLRRMRIKCPSLFPIRRGPANIRPQDCISLNENTMSDQIREKW